MYRCTVFVLFACALFLPKIEGETCEPGPICQVVCKECDHKSASPVLLYKMMSPAAIFRSATYIDKNNVLSAEQLTFNGDAKLPVSPKMLQIPLLAASVQANQSIVVKIAVGLDKTIGGTKGIDSDVAIMLSDGQNVHGFWIVDMNNYVQSDPYSPCYGVEGKGGARLREQREARRGPPPMEKTLYPGRVEITVNVAERWGYCYTAHDAGFTRQMSYTRKLDPSRGLSLELYGDDKEENHGIKFIEVTVLRAERELEQSTEV